MAEFVRFGQLLVDTTKQVSSSKSEKTYPKASGTAKDDSLAPCLDIMREAERTGKTTDPTYLECKRQVTQYEKVTGKTIYTKYIGLPTGAYFGKKLGPLTKNQTSQAQKEKVIYTGSEDPLPDEPADIPNDPSDDLYTNGDTMYVPTQEVVTPGFFDKLKSYLPSWWPWGLGALALLGGGYYITKKRGGFKGLRGFSGMTAQQSRFKAAAKACKGKPGYRGCMSRKLRG